MNTLESGRGIGLRPWRFLPHFIPIEIFAEKWGDRDTDEESKNCGEDNL